MSLTKTKNEIPNWILFLFFGTLTIGAMYAVFNHGFLNRGLDNHYRKSAGLIYEKANPLKPVFTSFPARNAAAISEGETLYNTRCSACHGSDIKGMAGNGPSLIDNDWWHVKKPTEQEIAAIIISGIVPPKSRQGVMPARGGGLTNDQIFKVMYFLSTKTKSIIKDAK